MNKTEIKYKEVPHDKSYCYLSIIDLLGKITEEENKSKRMLIYTMIMKEIRHIV